MTPGKVPAGIVQFNYKDQSKKQKNNPSNTTKKVGQIPYEEHEIVRKQPTRRQPERRVSCRQVTTHPSYIDDDDDDDVVDCRGQSPHVPLRGYTKEEGEEKTNECDDHQETDDDCSCSSTSSGSLLHADNSSDDDDDHEEEEEDNDDDDEEQVDDSGQDDSDEFISDDDDEGPEDPCRGSHDMSNQHERQNSLNKSFYDDDSEVESDDDMIKKKQKITKKQELVCKIDEKPSAIKLKEKTKDPILDPQSGTCGQSPLDPPYGGSIGPQRGLIDPCNGSTDHIEPANTIPLHAGGMELQQFLLKHAKLQPSEGITLGSLQDLICAKEHYSRGLCPHVPCNEHEQQQQKTQVARPIVMTITPSSSSSSSTAKIATAATAAAIPISRPRFEIHELQASARTTLQQWAHEQIVRITKPKKYARRVQQTRIPWHVLDDHYRKTSSIGVSFETPIDPQSEGIIYHKDLVYLPFMAHPQEYVRCFGCGKYLPSTSERPDLLPGTDRQLMVFFHAQCRPAILS